MDKAYIERANGHWEAWTYSDGRRVFIAKGNKSDVMMYCVMHGYSFIEVK